MEIIKLDLSGHQNPDSNNIYINTKDIDFSDSTEHIANQLRCRILDMAKTLQLPLNQQWSIIAGSGNIGIIACAIIHGLTGEFPILIDRGKKDGVWIEKEPFNLQTLRREISRNRE